MRSRIHFTPCSGRVIWVTPAHGLGKSAGVLPHGEIIMADDLKIPFDKYAKDAYDRKVVLKESAETAKSKTQGLPRKASAMGDTFGFFDGRQHIKDLAQSDKAYDERQNQRESEMEDMQKRFELNT